MSEEIYYPQIRCLNCSTFNHLHNKFCISCGIKMVDDTKFCGKCSSVLRKKLDKCKSCKTKLSTAEYIDDTNLDDILKHEKTLFYTTISDGLSAGNITFDFKPILLLLRKRLRYLPTVKSFVEGKGNPSLIEEYKFEGKKTGEDITNEIFSHFSNALAIGLPTGDMMQRMMSLLYLGTAGKYLHLVPSLYALGIGVEQPKEISTEKPEVEQPKEISAEKPDAKSTDGPYSVDGTWHCKCNTCGKEWQAMQMSFEDEDLKDTNIMGDKDSCSCGSSNIQADFVKFSTSMGQLDAAFGEGMEERMHAAADAIIKKTMPDLNTIPSKEDFNKSMLEMMTIAMGEPKIVLLLRACIDYTYIILDISKLGIDSSKKMSEEDQLYEFPFRYDGNLRDEFIIYYSLLLTSSEKDRQKTELYEELGKYLYLYGKGRRSENYEDYVRTSLELYFQIINETWNQSKYSKAQNAYSFIENLIKYNFPFIQQCDFLGILTEHVQFISEYLDSKEQITTNLIDATIKSARLVYFTMKMYNLKDESTKLMLEEISKIYSKCSHSQRIALLNDDGIELFFYLLGYNLHDNLNKFNAIALEEIETLKPEVKLCKSFVAQCKEGASQFSRDTKNSDVKKYLKGWSHK